ncbi:acyl-CoA dehydrogenase family protein [Streptomyces thermodiastaticus]|uniref:acyl-CoA dehydrogenase family protein n=1 Tax=Streptomyces thermodiastaticus TaxID=44061 RepID=UPI0016778571|nr:acyl-CoA dehydrogenase family protein [Streptomyces thermodiastaticus]MCE7550796.1 acyl-CoA dehydrogenase family protein [Streptomyces thermodiastaticus]GHF74748.1 acyl-CoA dehydrogenase [Streptomyces thermodiastaticus]
MAAKAIDVTSVLAAVREIVPKLRENGLEAEDRRWLPDENVELLEKAGVFRMATPKVFGGLEFSVADQAAVFAEIARGDVSTSWIASVWVSSAWMITLFPEELQKEIFATPDVRISGGFTPSGVLTPVEGGFVLNGSWKFNSGCRGAQWNIATSLVQHPDGRTEEAIALVPMREFTIEDDWNTSSVAATGSCTSTAADVFVPAHRVVPTDPAVFEAALAQLPEDRQPTGREYGLYSYIISQGVATFLGAARGALELFLDRLPGRGITYTSWTDQKQHPLTQIQVATADAKISAAEALMQQTYQTLQRRADAGEQPTLEEKAAVRGHSAYAVQLVKEAVDVLYNASGATAIQRRVPIQRFHRDIQGLALHGMILLTSSLEVHGRVLLGLDPDTPLL